MCKKIVKKQKELQNIFKAIEQYVNKNESNVCFIGGFMAFDAKKMEKKDDDIIIDEASDFVAFGTKEVLKVLLKDLQHVVKCGADKDGFVIY